MLAFDGDTVVGALPYVHCRKMGFRFLLQPQLTQYCGPWLRQAGNQAVFEKLFHDLRNLHYDYLQFNLSPAVYGAAIPEFLSVAQRLTLRINDISNPGRVFDAFDKRRRQRHILKAQEELVLTEDISPRQFAEFHRDYWQRRGSDNLLSISFLEHVVSVALQRRQASLKGLRDAQGHLQVASFEVFDSHEAHSLVSALGESHHIGARPLLFWHSIQRLSDHTKIYDFEGSMDPGIAYSYKLYGAEPASFVQVTHCPNPLLKVLMKIKSRPL